VVLVAADATEAKRLAATTRPSLLVTDVRLPGLDGPTLAADISEAHPGLPVLFVSGYSNETIIDRGELGEDAAFLAKPFTAAELARRVRELLDGVKPLA
jgi:DNA-binding response OmpR family regulator